MLSTVRMCLKTCPSSAVHPLILLLLGICVSWMAGAQSAHAGKTSRWGANYFPNWTLTSHDGRKFRFYDDLVKDKIVVVNFMYTSCTDICPLMTARLAEVKRRLGRVVGRDIYFYSISLDPERDTLKALKTHAQAFNAGKGWLFLTGSPMELADIRYKLGERSRSLSEHRTDLVLGNDRTRQWQRSSTMLDLDRLALVIREMDPLWRKQQNQHRLTKSRQTRTARRIVSTGLQGQGLFKKACAVCHSIGHGDRVGPDLRDVSKRRGPLWLTDFIMKPGTMRANKDPIALSLVKRFPGRAMPYLGLSKTDVKDVLSYIRAKSKELAATGTGFSKTSHAQVR